MKFLAAIFLVLFSSQVLARSAPIDACMSGSFYDPEASGEGINVEVTESYVLVYFYDMSGTWMFLQGANDGRPLEAYQNWYGNTYNVGSGYFIPAGYDNVEFGFDLLLDVRDVTFERPIPWCLRSDCARDFEYQRLTQPIPCPDPE
jgi:hypothetical protein